MSSVVLIVPGCFTSHLQFYWLKMLLFPSVQVEISCFYLLFQFPRVRGRGWNRGNYPGNNSNGNPANMNPAVRPPEEEWDPEYTPKSRKYYLVSERVHSVATRDIQALKTTAESPVNILRHHSRTTIIKLMLFISHGFYVSAVLVLVRWSGQFWQNLNHCRVELELDWLCMVV